MDDTALARGTKLEALGVELYEQVTNRETRRLPEKRLKSNPYLMVHADRVILKDPRGPGILEQKTPGQYAFKKYQKEGLPAAYILQLQWGMGLWGYSWGSFSLFWADGWRVLWFDITFDASVFEHLVLEAERFQREVESGPLPDALPVDDPRCPRCPWRATCYGPRLMEMVGQERDETIVDAPELEPVVADYLEAKALVAEHSEVLELVRDRLEEQLGERQAVQAGKHLVYFRRQADGVMLDEAALKKHGDPEVVAELYRKFGKPRRGARPLRII